MDDAVRKRVHPGVILAPLLAVALLASAAAPGVTGPFPVLVQGEARSVLPGMTLGQALAMTGLSPAAGDLVDVQGKVLIEGAYPGRVLLNGEEGEEGALLAPGDRIRLVDGRDHRERVDREVIPVPAGRPGNPQFFLATTPGEQIVTRGRVSGKLVSTVFVPKGPTRIAPAVALTFDDGPSPTWTPRILEVLERLDVPATFFVVGYLAERHPQLIRRELRAGMAVATHSWGHPLSPPFEEIPAERVREEVTRGAEGLRDLGIPVSLFRPPFGSYSDRVIEISRRAGLRLVLWSVDPGDWRRGATAKMVVDNVRKNVRAGSIILLHDGGGDRSATVKALPKIVRLIRSRGLELVAIGAERP